MLGDSISAGKLSLKLNVLSQQGGKQLKLGLTSQIADLSRSSANALTQAALALKLNGQVNDFKKITLSNYRLDLTQQAQPALTVSGSAGYDGARSICKRKSRRHGAIDGQRPGHAAVVGVKLDGSFTNQVLDLRQLQLAPRATQRAEERVELRGTRLSTPTTKGRLSQADTFDLTQLYDAFAGKKLRDAATGSRRPRHRRRATWNRTR